MSSSSVTRRLFLLLTGGMVSKVGHAEAGADDRTLSAAEIMSRMAKTYASSTSYQDSGSTTVVFLDGDTKRTESTPFSTAFVRPGRFRFEFKTSFAPYDPQWKRYLVWADGADIRTWWDVQPGVHKPASLDLALAGATGVSGGSAHTVPALLMPDRITGRRLQDLVEMTRLENAMLDGAACFRIQGKLPGSNDPARQERIRQEILKTTHLDPGLPTEGPRTFWIDRTTFLLRRIDAETRWGEKKHSESTTTYDPVMDREVSEKQLQFDPPVA